MLDPWIIEEILRREDDRRREEGREHLELPLESPRYRETDKKPGSPVSDDQRGVIIIDI